MNQEPSCPRVSSTAVAATARVRRFPLVLTVFLLLPAGALPAGPYSLDWCATGAGGGTSGGGGYALSGTIGQTDCAVTSGGSYRVDGGFWPGLTVPSTMGAPTLVIQRANDHVRLSWSPATPGFTLEQSEDLSALNWIPAPAGNPATVPMSAKARFFRLRKP